MYCHIVMCFRIGELLEVFRSLDKAKKDKEREENRREQEETEERREGGGEGGVAPTPTPDNESTVASTVRRRYV